LLKKKMLFIGYYYGILSERELAKRIQTDLAYRWFLGYDLDERMPTHSVLSKARNRYGVGVFQSVFDRIVEQCISLGLVGGEQAFMDATLIEANASMGSLVPRLRVLKASEYAEEMLQGSKETDSDASGGPPKESKLNEKMVSKTDPDASVQSRKGKKRGLYYQGHFLIDGTARVITEVEATDTTDSADKQAFPLLMRDRFRHGLSYSSFCADAEYGTQTLYHSLFSVGIIPYIPPPDSRSPHKGQFAKDDFSYNSETDEYICPSGHHLVRKGYDESKKRYEYSHAVPGTCKECSLRKRCTRSKGDRRIKRLLYQTSCDQARAIAQTPSYRRQIMLRRIMTEPLFGEAKDNHGLRSAFSRGLERVKIQVLCTATVLNIKRMLRWSRRLPQAGIEALRSLEVDFARNIERILTSILSCQKTIGCRWELSISYR